MDIPKLDRLVSELNASGQPVSARRLEDWLSMLRAQGGSDLYLVAGLPPSVRVDGTIRPLVDAVLDGDDIETAVFDALPAYAIDSYRAKGHADASLRRAGGGRFRINL